MAKKVIAEIKLQIPAGKANPEPAGRARARSARRQHHGVLQGSSTRGRRRRPGLIIPVVITVYADRSFTFITKTPPASILLKKAAGRRRRGSGEPNKIKVGKVTREAGARRSRELKMPDLNAAEPRGGDAHHRGHGAQHGPRGRVTEERRWRSTGKTIPERRPTQDRPRQALRARRGVQAARGRAAAAKFDETRRLAVRLGVDPRHADQMVRGAVVLPHGTGKSVRVARLRQGRQGEGGARRPAPTSSAPRTSSKKIQEENWIDFDTRDRDARHDGRWSVGSAASSARAA